MGHTIRRVAIVDRGTAALRAIRALREFNQEQNLQLRSIVLFTQSDQAAYFVQEADEAFSLGTNAWTEKYDSGVASRYCNLEAIEKVLITSKADAVWCGWMSEQAELAELCQKLGITYIGAHGDHIRHSQDPEWVHKLVEQAGIYISPSEDSAEGIRHLSVHTLTDNHGHTWAFGVIDKTLNFGQKTALVETPSPKLAPEQEQNLMQTALRLVQAAGFTNAVTVCFHWNGADDTISKVGFHCSNQADHVLTETRFGIDLVKLQFQLALGGTLEDDPPTSSGLHTAGVELNAVPLNSDLPPRNGVVASLRPPCGPGLRVDVGVSEGDSVNGSGFSSPGLALVTATGRTRSETLSRLKQALLDCSIVINGQTTNKSWLLSALNHPGMADGVLKGPFQPETATNPTKEAVALLQAAIEVYQAEFAVEQAQFVTSAARGRPQVRREPGLKVELSYLGQLYSITVSRTGPQAYRLEVDKNQIPVTIAWSNRFERRLVIGGHNFHTFPVATEPNFVIEVDGTSHQITREDLGAVRSPTPAIVVSVKVKEGELVQTGDLIAVLESMKLEVPVLAPYAGKVRKVFVLANVQVDTGAPLIQLELVDHQQKLAHQPAKRLNFKELLPEQSEPVRSQCQHNFEVFRSFLLGYDIKSAEIKRWMTEHGQLCQQLPPNDAELLQHEHELLAIFTDLSSLFHRQSEEDPEHQEILASQEYLLTYLRTMDATSTELPTAFLEKLLRGLAYYGVNSFQRCPQLEESLLWIFKAHLKVDQFLPIIMNILERRLAHREMLQDLVGENFRRLLNRTIEETQENYPTLSDLAREVRFRYFDQHLFEQVHQRIDREVEATLDYLEKHPGATDREERIKELVECPQPLAGLLSKRFSDVSLSMQQLLLEVLTRRYYRIRHLENFQNLLGRKHIFVTAQYTHPLEGVDIHLACTLADYSKFAETGEEMSSIVETFPQGHDVMIDFYFWHSNLNQDMEAASHEIQHIISQIHFPRHIRRISVSVAGLKTGNGNDGTWHFTYRPSEAGYQEEKAYRSLHPMMGKRLHLWRMSNFNIERLPSSEDVYLFHGVARENPKDERLFAVAEVRDLTLVRNAQGRIEQIPYMEHMLMEASAGMRKYLATRSPKDRPEWNRVLLYVWPTLDWSTDELNDVARKLLAGTKGIGLECIVLRAKIKNQETGEIRDTALWISNPGGLEPVLEFHAPPDKPLLPMTDYERKVMQLHRRGMVYPYEIINILTSAKGEKIKFPPGEFTEYDLNDKMQLIPVSRPFGKNTANLVVGVIRNITPKYPEGMTRVIMLGDPSKSVGAVAEPECRRISAAIELASKMKVPLEWFPVSAGAKISMETGTENMDWVALVLRKLIEFTQAGGEVNILVNGINVGAQPYWNAEATMLMHTKGILIMTPNGAMVLTGKRALDFSGSVSADDNFGIGGYERVMGPNGQAQYWAKDLVEGCQILLHHYEHTYVVPYERFPRKATTTDPIDRDIRNYPYTGAKADGFLRVGEIFTEDKNAGRKRPFDVRSVMRATIDQDHQPLERWGGFRDAEIPVIWDAHLGGYPVCLIGIESRPLPRLGFISADGPYQWTAGTLFPQGSKKVARAVNAASGNRPLVVLANLSGFDGSPESMRKCQLEFGAEIGRAVVNFKGPIVFCVISRYHGGAYVVFSSLLNEQVEAAALEGSFASVIGGSPAAAVVFAGDVEKRTKADERIQKLEKAIAQAEGPEKGRLRAEYTDLYNVVYSEKLGQVAEEFDHVHSVHRALQVGSLHHIIPSATLRPYLIDAVERGMQRTLEQLKQKSVAKHSD